MEEIRLTKKDVQEKYKHNVNAKEQFSYRAEYAYQMENTELKEQVIFYESAFGKATNAGPYAMFRTLYKDPRYKNYRHVWSLDSLEGGVYDAFKRKKNVKFVKRKSKEYFEALASSKYIVSNKPIPFYYVRRSKQYYVLLLNKFEEFMFCNRYKTIKEQSMLRNIRQATHLVCDNNNIFEHVKKAAQLDKSFMGYSMVHKIGKWDAVHEKASQFAEIIGDEVILNKNQNHFVKIYNGKRNVLLCSGSLAEPGKSEIFLGILKQFDCEKDNIHIVIPKSENKEVYEIIEKINENLVVHIRYGEFVVTEQEYVEYRLLQENCGIGYNKEILKKLSNNEFRRICGDIEFNRIIDFNGEGISWTTLSAFADSETSSIFLHNDMKQVYEEAIKANSKDVKRLETIFNLYSEFDELICTTEEYASNNLNGILKNKEKENTQKMRVQSPSLDESILDRYLKNQIEEIKIGETIYNVAFETSNEHRLKLFGYKKLIKQRTNFICLAESLDDAECIEIIDLFCEVIRKKSLISLYITIKENKIEEISNYVRKINMNSTIFPIRKTDMIYDLMKNCDYTILLSNSIGTGMDVLKSLYLGTPVIAIDNAETNRFKNFDNVEIVSYDLNEISYLIEGKI